MAVGFSNTNKPINPRGQDASPLAYNRAKLYSGKALDFDGVNDVVNITTDDIDLQEFSVVQYVNLGATAASKIFYSNYAPTGNLGFATGISDSTANVPKFYTKGTSSDTLFGSFALNAGEWYQIVATYDGATKKIYVNGVLDTEVAFSDTILYTNATNQIGALSGGTAQALDGSLSNVKVYSTALTAAQIADLYNNPEKVVPTGVDNTALKLWLPMMEGAGTTAYDGSGNGSHGTISGATYVNGVGSPVAQSAVMDWNKGTNILENTNIFDGYWTKSGGTLTTGIEAPDGTNTAFKFERDNASSGTIYATGVAGLDQNKYRYVYAKLPSGTGSAQLLSHNTNTNNTFTITDQWQRFEVDSSPLIPDNFYIVDFRAGVGVNEIHLWAPQATATNGPSVFVPTIATTQPTPVLLPQGLTTGRDITGVNLFENVRKQGALNLDGNSWAEVHDNASLDITSAITLEAWVYNDGSSFDGFLGRWFTTGNNRSVMIYESSSNEARMIVAKDGANGFNANGTMISGWNHIVGTCDDTEIKIYINGVKGTDGTAPSGSIHVSSYPYEIGRYNSSVSSSHTNQIAQPRIYNRALTAEEVLRNYNSGKNTYK